MDTHLASEKSEALLQKEKELLENPDVNLFKTDVQGAIDKLHEERTEKDLKLLVNHSRRLHCLCNMSDDELKTLWQYLEYQNYPKNTRLFEKGDIGEHMYIIWSGQVTVRIPTQLIKDEGLKASVINDEVVVNTLGEGQLMGESLAKSRGTRMAACVTNGPTELLTLDREGCVEMNPVSSTN